MVELKRAAAGLLVGAVAAAGCRPAAEQAASTSEARMIQTDSPTYDVDTTGGEIAIQVALRLTNDTGDSIFLATCGVNTPAYVLERLVGDTWTVAVRPVCPMILTPPLVAAAGESRTDTVAIRASLARPGARPVSEPRFQGETVAGTYRILYEAFRQGWGVRDRGPDPSARLPVDARTSNRFELRP